MDEKEEKERKDFWDSVLEEAYHKAVKGGFKRQLFWNDFKKDILYKNDICVRSGAVQYVIDTLIAIQKVTDLGDKGVISESGMKFCGKYGYC